MITTLSENPCMTRKLISIEFARKLENTTADLADEIENEIHEVG